ncbi:Cur1p NDAI_0B05940 [Naumovozyma dairenensis CBS 421]|uniref:Uncharacterized protein n=1 Tax=Naumovozyma dairenensis (strain ATCC 10597 / BCRC 20456 / CBS 421 / NBRC 0211 / NRRL Y-12639) TaxID=1071378 RepID=G0W765_NAUDC|nr:hypothetical protein NDAI_0B05940 [Naumovozyma dairenensis CBS 421]CCD23626.1 hypothetical protein NDAI_0B05940 [Naumovozyma dairenensis CBS 421]
MFSFYNSPTLFDTLPIFQQLSNQPESYDNLTYYPSDIKRRRTNNNIISSGTQHHAKKTSLSYSLNQKDDESTMVLSLMKRIPKHIFTNSINEKIKDLKEQNYNPTYNIIEDSFGNQYYMEVGITPKEDELLTKRIMNKLDISAMEKQIVKDSFKDYQLELNHRGDELRIQSCKDQIAQDLDLPHEFDDFNILEFKIDNDNENDSYDLAILKIGLTLDGNKKTSRPQHHRHRHHHSHHSTHKKSRHSSYHKSSNSNDDSGSFPQHLKEAKNEKKNIVIHSPILEEIDDEEVAKYNDSLLWIPSGNAIVEEAI